MKPHVSNQKTAALTLVEVLVVIFVLFVLVAMILPWWNASRHHSQDVNCANKLKEIGQAFLTWEHDHNGKLPTQVSIVDGGAMELIAAGNVAACFQTISNGLSSPKVLICPTERIRRAAANFQNGFDNSHVSYFVGLDADTNYPNAFLSGDDNLTLNGVPVKSGLVEISTNRYSDEPFGHVNWADTRHYGISGNICLADGSVRESYQFRLRMDLRDTGLATNRLVIP
jgi:competence protein ComGC